MHIINNEGIGKKSAANFQKTEMKIKILEYLACNKPVITTRKGIEGIKKRKKVIIEESVKRFSEKICRIILKID